MMEKPICAVATPYGKGAISIIRCSGLGSIELVSKLFKGKDLTSVPSHTLNYGHIMDKEGNYIDEVLVSVFKAPKTYTKEDCVEINVHGGWFVTNKILELLLRSGFSLAEPGEFTKRAFLNGRIDLMQAESVIDVINSENDLMLTNANRGLRKELSNLIEETRNQLLDLIAKIEVNIDYPEYDDAVVVTQNFISPVLVDIHQKLDDILKLSKIGRRIKEGIDTAIIGRPNVGKSSLLNMLLDEDRAIVSHVAGTTRDTIESKLNIGNVVLNLIDTAGIHETKDFIEQIGIKKAKEVLDKAELVLLVIDNSDISDYDYELIKLTENKKRIIVVNKIDLNQEEKIKEDHINISALNNLGLEQLVKEIQRLSEVEALSNKDANYLTNVRQIAELKEADEAITDAMNSANDLLPVDMIEIDIKKAWELLGNVIGISQTDELIDNLFSKFCLGK